MSTLKTKIDKRIVLKFLVNNFAADIKTLDPVKGGEKSQVFSFSSKKNEFIIRMYSKKLGFEKDKYAYEHFNSEKIPIPKTFQTGKLNEALYYSITGKVKGKIIDHFTKDEIRKLVPQLIKTLDTIHNLDISKTNKFGLWDSSGHGSDVSWKSYLSRLIEKFGSYKNKRPEEILLEESLVEKILARYKRAIDYCPNVRHLVHGDYGFDNLFSDDSKITGVIDWELSRYGDFLFDVAWLDFWEAGIDYLDIFKKHYKKTGVSIPNFQERILCYKLLFGLGSLHFFSNSGQKRKYNRTKKRLLQLV